MVKTFTTGDWNQDIKNIHGTMEKGILIPMAVADPIIQIFKHIRNDQYQLVTVEAVVGVSSTEVVLMTPQPFNGKVVIK